MRFLAVRLFWLVLLIPAAAGAESLPEPCVAIERAEGHFRQNGIDTAGQHLQTLRRQYDTERRMYYWEIQWAWDTPRLGMELFARVYQDGRVEWRRLGP